MSVDEISLEFAYFTDRPDGLASVSAIPIIDPLGDAEIGGASGIARIVYKATFPRGDEIKGGVEAHIPCPCNTDSLMMGVSCVFSVSNIQPYCRLEKADDTIFMIV